jgi:pyridoxamine 5'-phosphate oxidase
MKKQSISDIRREYTLRSLNEAELEKNPIVLFEQWLAEAIDAQCNEPTAMTLATSTFDGKPTARVVLLKELSEDGFTFFTNYESKKGKQILQNPYGALVFYWSELERQVRVEGVLKKTSEKQSDRYFSTRPEKSKIGAWASPQSQVIPSRKYLESLKSDFQEEFSGKPISRPPNWGGYTLIPSVFEFWQGRPNRLHDRIQFSFLNDNWEKERLAP